jgi:hypothetical protein
VEVGAIVIVEAESPGVDRSAEFEGSDLACRFADGPLCFLDLLGESVLERKIEQFLAAQLRATTLLVHTNLLPSMPSFRHEMPYLNVEVTNEIWPLIAQVLKTYSENGIRCAFIANTTAYAEADFTDMFEFHSHAERSVTRASDGEGPLDLWVVDCETEGQKSGAALKAALTDPAFLPASYFVREYVRRFTHPRDCRQLVTDALLSRCAFRPLGQQIRPGVWADEGTQIRRGARIVGPAYLGRHCLIGESALITRYSNVESGSYIDYGTAIEDSSVLSNTYVGMWLDVRHSVAHANKLLHLERSVMIEISDPTLLRSNPLPGKISRRPLVDVPETWRARRSLAGTEIYRNKVRPVNTTTEFES